MVMQYQIFKECPYCHAFSMTFSTCDPALQGCILIRASINIVPYLLPVHVHIYFTTQLRQLPYAEVRFAPHTLFSSISGSWLAAAILCLVLVAAERLDLRVAVVSLAAAMVLALALALLPFTVWSPPPITSSSLSSCGGASRWSVGNGQGQGPYMGIGRV